MNPVYAINNLDLAWANALYDPLIRFDRTGRPTLYLASEMTPNSNATEWTIRLRSGVTFHNGKALTAEDLIYSFQQILNPKKPGTGAPSLSTLEVGKMKKLDNLTARLSFTRPFSTLPALLAAYYYFVLPVGFDPKNPVGTGPYRYKSFAPGIQSTFVRNDHYWLDGLPYTDGLVLTDISDETAGVNALMAGDLDCFDISSAAIIGELQAQGVRVVISPGGGFIPFVMQVATPPFADVRVRQAFRLIVDREQMIRAVWDGHGTVGNDIFSIWDPMYDHAIPQRKQNIAEARSLLKSAGHKNLRVELVTAPIQPGALQQAEVFAAAGERRRCLSQSTASDDNRTVRSELPQVALHTRLLVLHALLCRGRSIDTAQKPILGDTFREFPLQQPLQYGGGDCEYRQTESDRARDAND